MKKKSLSLLLLISGSVVLGQVEQWVEEKVSDVKKGVQTIIKDPKKAVTIAVNQHLKLVGINLGGIVSNVNSVQTSVETIKKDTALVQQAWRAPRSPISKSSVISKKMNQFQIDALALSKSLRVTSISEALSSSSALSRVVQKLSSAKTQADVRNFYSSYLAVIAEIDSVETRPILQHARKTLYDVAGLLDTVLHIRDYAGTLAKLFFLPRRAAAISAVSADLRKIAQNLNDLSQDELIRPLMPVQSELATRIISNLGNVNKLTVSFEESAQSILPKMNLITNELDQITKAKNKLIVSASSIKTRLQRYAVRSLTLPKAPAIPALVAAQLRKIIKDIRFNVDVILRHTTAVLELTADVIDISSDGLNSFKKYIKFDIVTPRARATLDELPKNVRDLSRSITTLRKMIP